MENENVEKERPEEVREAMVARPEMATTKKMGQRPGVGVGRIVLVKTNDGERPMLIVKVWNPTTVNGVIFLDGWNDRGLAIIGTREGSLLSWATSIQRGSEVNQWRFYDD